VLTGLIIFLCGLLIGGLVGWQVGLKIGVTFGVKKLLDNLPEQEAVKLVKRIRSQK